uniref:rRNA processing protein EBP2 n=1 Tax=Wuchereria bancrofti TaxID=6293 RepID=A0A1I8ELF4_WUCBA
MLNAKRGEMSTTDDDVNARILPAIESEEESSDSDRELQIAFDEGLLKTDKLNYIVEKKRPIINKKAELEDKVKKLAMNLTWLETLDVQVNNDHLNEKVLSDDFEREIIFYKQAEKAAQIAVSRLRGMGVRVFRPTDYYAEMIRQRMAEIEESKQKLEAIRRIREEKKFAAKVIERKQSEKKILAEAVKKHRKGVKSHLDAMLSNAKRIQDTEVGIKRSEKGRMREKNKRFRRVARDKKFGFGGQKKRSKKNDKNSFEEIATPGSLARKLKGHHFGAHVLKSGAKPKKK